MSWKKGGSSCGQRPRLVPATGNNQDDYNIEPVDTVQDT